MKNKVLTLDYNWSTWTSNFGIDFFALSTMTYLLYIRFGIYKGRHTVGVDQSCKT